MIDFLLNAEAGGIRLAMAIIAVAWLWEDAAVISGALLAADESLSIPLALVAVFVGIFSGDVALYFLGRLANRSRRLRAKLLLNAKFRALRKVFRRKTLLNILIIRFIPGLRTLGFTLCGLWKINLGKFIAAMSLAGLLWIAVIFTGVYWLGASSLLATGYWKWSLMLIALALLVFNNLYFRYRLKTKMNK
ncbi:MAG: VTT domain-containing protein [Cellvibrionaceae bacterium]|nr:VTT domain-containing protein [Cellvibrionaceae bacterium]